MPDWTVPALPIFMELLERVHPRNVHMPVGVHGIARPEYRRQSADACGPLEQLRQLWHGAVYVVGGPRPSSRLVVLLRALVHRRVE